jgi:hypothetical protein
MATVIVRVWPGLNCSTESARQQDLIESPLSGNQEVSHWLIKSLLIDIVLDVFDEGFIIFPRHFPYDL